MSKPQTSSMAAVGAYDTVLPFQAVGVKPYVLAPNDSPADVLQRLAAEGCGVVFVEEAVYQKESALVDRLNLEYGTSIIPIPGIRGSLGTGLRAIRASVERAVGMDIFAKE
ncbi:MULTISPECIES: V-type ATP synthase subunit F [Jonquetella]|uniref:Vacuolar-type H+-ATPase subunit F n=1 Tax=Jonquetella anthropi DSM 22815 TaxID=885272 RepID=H0UMA3_9BACT|nr:MULTISPECIES: V-type ATP synthase subunit F [Jonquetella]EHM12576.1 vacuolar-type H+-ATPase subunit F [Jonquetella anthropi DSM 22815]